MLLQRYHLLWKICITNEKLDKTGFEMKSNYVDFDYDMDDQVLKLYENLHKCIA